MPRLDEYSGLLTAQEAVECLEGLMGSFAPALETFRTYARPSYRLANPDSPAAHFLKPVARNVARGNKSAWTREQLTAYAQALASRSGAAQGTEQPCPS